MSAAGRSSTKDGVSMLGIGIAACAVCCAGPLLGFLAAVGLGTVIGIAVFGVVGLAIAVLAIVPIVRRRRAAACATDETVSVVLGRQPS